VFVGIIMVASICGPSIGGILADGIGSRATFFVSSALASLSAWLAWRKLPADGLGNAALPETAKPPLSIAFANRRFLALLLFAAIPAKVVLIAYCYYLVPLFVMDTGASPAMAGRIVMLYAIMTTVLGPLAAEWSTMLSTRFPQRSAPLFIVLGLALSGLAGVLMAVPVGMFGPVIVVILLGLGQSLSISPQATMVAEICASEIRSLGQSAVYGVYRMVERFGNAAAPLIAAALVETGGFRVAFVTIGLATLACTAAFAFTFLYRRPTVIVADRSSSP
jgi:MFS family permease